MNEWQVRNEQMMVAAGAASEVLGAMDYRVDDETRCGALYQTEDVAGRQFFVVVEVNEEKLSARTFLYSPGFGPYSALPDVRTLLHRHIPVKPEDPGYDSEAEVNRFETWETVHREELGQKHTLLGDWEDDELWLTRDGEELVQQW